MDEREFLGNADIDQEEKIYLQDNLNRINFVIKDVDDKIKFKKDLMDQYRGETQFYNDYIKYLGEFNYYKDIKSSYLDILGNPYYFHANLTVDDDSLDVYVGEKGISDKNNNIIVYDWRSKVGDFAVSNKNSITIDDYDYFANFKRKLSIKNSRLESVSEIYKNGKFNNEEITDFFLKEVAKSKKNIDGFTDIIKTIQEKQNEIIRADANTGILCQGVAGSGKTAVIVHRLSYLLFNNKDGHNKYLFIAPSDNFKKELSSLNKKLEIDKIPLFTLYEYYIDKLNEYFSVLSKDDKSLVKQVLDDKNIDISNYYSKKYVEKKYNIFETHIYKKLDPIAKIYKYSFDKNNTIKYNVNNLMNNIDLILNRYNLILYNLRKDINSISELIKGVGFEFVQNDVTDIKLKTLLFKQKAKNKIEALNANIINSELFLNTIKSDYKELSKKYNYSLDNIRNEIVIINDLIESIKIENEKMINSIYYVFNRNKVENNLNQIKDLEILLSSLNELEDWMINSPDEYELYLETIVEIPKSKAQIDVLQEAMVLVEKFFELGESYQILSSTNYKTFTNYLEFKRSLINFLNFIEFKTEYVEIEDIKKLSIVFDKVNSDSKEFDKEEYFKASNDKKSVIKTMSFDEINDILFNEVFENKYFDEKIHNLNIENIYRNDAFVILYIFSRMELKKSNKYSYVYIDEAQDYNDLEIKLIADLEVDSCINIFGDYKQNISNNSSPRNNWNSLMTLLGNKLKYYELNENYRNTSNVVKYTNKVLKLKMSSLGIDGKDVICFDTLSYSNLIKLYNYKKFVVLCDDRYIRSRLKSLNRDIKCFSVFDAKGLEYENVIVIDKDLDINHKYVAYTRSKNDLIVINNVIIGEDNVNVDEIFKEDRKNKKIDPITKIEPFITDILVEDEKEFISDDVVLDIKLPSSFILNDYFFKEILNKFIKTHNKATIVVSDIEMFLIDNNVPEYLYDYFKIRLIGKGYKFEDNKFSRLSFDEKVSLFIRISDAYDGIADNEFIKLIKYFSNNVDEQDKIYDTCIEKGILINE